MQGKLKRQSRLLLRRDRHSRKQESQCLSVKISSCQVRETLNTLERALLFSRCPWRMQLLRTKIWSGTRECRDQLMTSWAISCVAVEWSWATGPIYSCMPHKESSRCQCTSLPLLISVILEPSSAINMRSLVLDMTYVFIL